MEEVIVGNLSLCENLFNIDQNVFGAALGLLSLLVIISV